MNALSFMNKLKRLALVIRIKLLYLFNKIFVTTAHPWCGGLSTSISACGVWGVGGKGRDSSLHEGASHTYTLRLN